MTGAKLRQRDAHGVIDVLVVRRLAANHRAQAKNGGVPSGGGQSAGHRGNFKRPGRPGDVDVLLAHAVGQERLRRPRPAAGK